MIVHCVVCETEMEDAEAFVTVAEEGDASEDCHFCSARCLEDFELEPERYLAEGEMTLEAS